MQKTLASNIMDLLPQFNPDDYPDSPGYEPLLHMQTPSKISKCETTEIHQPVRCNQLHDQYHGLQFLGCPTYQVRCPRMESNFCRFEFESGLCRPSFGVKIRGSKPEKLGFHLASCNMQLLANYTKYYTFRNYRYKSLIYIGF